MSPIIALWSHPRSMSTAIERIMRERGDLDCAHEPFMYSYYVDRQVRVMPFFDVNPEHPKTYEEIRDHLLERAERGPVFFKDMSYYVVPRLFDDTDFADRLTHCFLIRDPLASIASYYKLDADLTLEEIGLEAQWLHFRWLLDRTGEAPAVLDAEAIQNNPKGLVGALWRHIGLAYLDHAFSWDQESRPDDWDQVNTWHGEANASGTIRRLDVAELEARRQRFAAAQAQAPHLGAFLDHHRRYYDKLRDYALTP